MKKLLTCALLLATGGLQAQEFAPEPVGVIDGLDSAYPSHWVMVRDFSFFHMLEGKVLVIDPLAETLGDQYKGMMTSSFIGG